MPSITLNKECSRCTRVENVPLSLADLTAITKNGGTLTEEPKHVVIYMHGAVVAEFPYLCANCGLILSRGLARLSKQLEQKSSLREGEEIEVE